MCYGWGTMRENTLKIGVLQGVGQYQPNFHVEGDVLHQSFSDGEIGQWMPCNSVGDSFYTKKLCSRLSSSKVRFQMENGHFVCLNQWIPVGGLGATYEFHLELIGKCISGLAISVNWTFFDKCYGWGATREYRLKIDVFVPMGPVWPKISGRRGRLPPTILLLRKLR